MYKINGSFPRPLTALSRLGDQTLTATITSQPVFVPGTIYNGAVIDIRVLDDSRPTAPTELAYELGLWLAGIEAFATGFEYLFMDTSARSFDSRNWYKALRLTRAGLLRASELLSRLRYSELDDPQAKPIATGEMYVEIAEVIRSLLVLNESLARAGSMRAHEWKAWRTSIQERLINSSAVDRFQSLARDPGESSLPEAVKTMIAAADRVDLETAELLGVLREYASVHKALTVISRMLRNDEPLKPALLIFAFVHEKATNLIQQINHRLAMLSDEESDFFIALDAASYTTSLELKKAFQQELLNVLGIRPAQIVYARIEVAQSLLSASFEEVITSFARSLDPSKVVADIFPAFKTKLEQSLVLRSALVSLLKAVKESEADPSQSNIENMRNTVEFFTHEAMHFLYYKDKETLERFVEEVQFTRELTDLVPILHRFGAYLETLLGQVNMRAVLANHPLEDA